MTDVGRTVANLGPIAFMQTVHPLYVAPPEAVVPVRDARDGAQPWTRNGRKWVQRRQIQCLPHDVGGSQHQSSRQQERR